MTTDTRASDPIVEEVRARYADAARAVLDSAPKPSRADASCCGPSEDAGFGQILYSTMERDSLPDAAVLASLGCGNPTAVAELKAGDIVLDLGSGGGIDVLLSANRVGQGGYAFGLEMTDEMLELARRNAAEAGISNVEFLKGQIEAIPLEEASVDVVISNCVINLSTDKAAVFGEIARVLRPGGRMAGLESVGLVDISVTPTHGVGDGLFSAIARATKPAGWSASDVRPISLPAPQPGLSVLAGSSCCGDAGCC